MTRLSTLLDEIDPGAVLLPEFQRGYVRNRDQVRGLMRSLYRGYPVGGLLVWETASQDIMVRGTVAGSGTRQLLLDGQQRVTSMYGLIRGAPPPFFEGDANAFTGLFFNVDKEVFEFHAPTKMAGDPTWVNVTELFRKGPFEYLTAFPDVERDVSTPTWNGSTGSRRSRTGTSTPRRSPAPGRPSTKSSTSSTRSTPAAPNCPRATLPWLSCAPNGPTPVTSCGTA